MKTVITEEKARAARINEASENGGTVPKPSEESPKEHRGGSEPENDRVRELERENLDLKITNKAKDYMVERLQKERDGFFDQLLAASHKVGELETRLQLEGPKNT